MVSACTKENPVPKVFMQVSSITDESGSIHQQITYDSYGRVTSFEYLYKDGSIAAEYEYLSDNLIKITTRDETYWPNGESNSLRIYDDELHLQNGRAVSCDGIFSLSQQGRFFIEKKYLHEFTYTPDNRLNVIKWTQWEKLNDGWAEDNPWTWENFYHWEDGDLTESEDYNGHSYPQITCTFKYDDIAEVQNILPIPMGRHQYFPLQLKGIFGSMPHKLIKEVNRYNNFDGNSTYSYHYNIIDGRIINYQELLENEVINTFSVQWTK